MRLKKFFFANFAFVFIIILTASIHYYYHFKTLQKEILSYIEIQATSIARRIEISASNIYKSHRFIKKIIENNLKSQAKFIDLMNSIERFKKDELKEFAIESGLNLVIIHNKNYSVSFLPDGFTEKEIKKLCKDNLNQIVFVKPKNLILYIYKGVYSDAKIITGIIAKKFFKKEEKLSVNALINKILSQRQDIKEIKIVNEKISKPQISLYENKYYLVKIPFEAKKNSAILIKFDAYHPIKILNNFKHNIHVFIIVMILIGIIGNFLIYVMHRNFITKLKEYDKRIAQNEKYAAIGRSAGIIAHEIRNPLNAIGIGLQRLQYETDISEHPEYNNLLNTILNELKRVNAKITTFLDYTKPIKVEKKEVYLKKLVEECLIYYKNLEIDIEIKIPEDLKIFVDKDLIMQLISNLFRNVFENENTTFLKILWQKDKLIIENDGVKNSLDTEKIFEPYYTTKTKGSGLGLAIAKKIIEAHEGDIYCELDGEKIKFVIRI